jgi:hypothetical protein
MSGHAPAPSSLSRSVFDRAFASPDVPALVEWLSSIGLGRDLVSVEPDGAAVRVTLLARGEQGDLLYAMDQLGACGIEARIVGQLLPVLRVHDPIAGRRVGA